MYFSVMHFSNGVQFFSITFILVLFALESAVAGLATVMVSLTSMCASLYLHKLNFLTLSELYTPFLSPLISN